MRAVKRKAEGDHDWQQRKADVESDRATLIRTKFSCKLTQFLHLQYP